MRFIAALFLLLTIAGCGYHIQGHGSNLPPEIRTTRIPIFANQTLEPFLENRVTNAVLERFSRGRALEVTYDSGNADSVLKGAIVRYVTTPIAYDADDNIIEYRSTLTLSATLEEAARGRILWSGSLSWSEEYPAGVDSMAQENFEEAAIREISERLADELYFRIVDAF